MGIDEGGARQTGERFEESTADAVYCPVLEAGKWNEVMEKLHRRDPGLARRWRESKRRPGPRLERNAQVTKVLALPLSNTETRWVLYAYEENQRGSGIAGAARYAERSGLKTLAIDGRNDSWLTSDEGRATVAEAASTHETKLVVHSR